MSVYVDEMLPCITNPNWRWSEVCHLVADTVAELHQFAAYLGLQRSWFQSGRVPHYDLTKNKRKKAIKLGAVPVDRKQFVLLMREIGAKQK